MNDRYLIFDESGNLGQKGRYFVISCIDTINYKPLFNVMKRKMLLAQTQFPELSVFHNHEVKAKDAYPCIKYHIAECIVQKQLTISYIVVDLKHIKPNLLLNKNILYNYLMKILIDRLIGYHDNGSRVHIMYDRHTTKVGSSNSLEEYIKLYLLYERGFELDIDFTSFDSNGSNAFHIQAADYVANAIYSNYEYNVKDYFNIYQPCFNKVERFPYKCFGL